MNHNGHIVRTDDPANLESRMLPDREVTELITDKPGFGVRWGATILLSVALLLVAVSWFIKYPDVITAKGILNSINAPKEVQARTSGKLVKLFVKENQRVHKTDVLGYLECIADYREVMLLSKLIDSMADKINKNETDQVVNYLYVQFSELGELQGGYQTFSASFNQFSNYLSSGFYLKKKAMLRTDLVYVRKMHETLAQQRELVMQDLIISDSTFLVNQHLKNEKVISAMDYRNEKSKLISKQLSMPQINALIINNESQQHEKLKEIAELENEIRQQKSVFIQALHMIKSQIEEWKRKYLLVAPVDGKIAFASFLQENEELKAGQVICYINPDSTQSYVEVLIPQYNFGKIKHGQQALLKFQAYPYPEFGSVEGSIDIINSIPSDSGFVARIALPYGLVTNYKKQIQNRPGLSVQVDIVTEEMRLPEKLFHQLRKNF